MQNSLVKARLKLAVLPGPTLIWNYLPVDIAAQASKKLEYALERCELVCSSVALLPRLTPTTSCAVPARFYVYLNVYRTRRDSASIVFVQLTFVTS
jgi:hypothetical protein